MNAESAIERAAAIAGFFELKSSVASLFYTATIVL